MSDKNNPNGITGTIRLDPSIVATIAGLAAKEIEGIHSVGKTPLLSFGDDPSRGVTAEIGEKQVAVDLDVVVEYGYDLRELTAELRKRTAEELEKMTGREVVEINVHVVDIQLPEDAGSKPRVI